MDDQLLWLLLRYLLKFNPRCLLHTVVALDVSRQVLLLLLVRESVLVFIHLLHELLRLEEHDELLPRKILNIAQET